MAEDKSHSSESGTGMARQCGKGENPRIGRGREEESSPIWVELFAVIAKMGWGGEPNGFFSLHPAQQLLPRAVFLKAQCIPMSRQLFPV